MYTTFHLASAQDLNADILDAIKTVFKSKPITILVEEDGGNYELTSELRSVLDDRLSEDQTTYLSGEESIEQLQKKYGV